MGQVRNGRAMRSSLLIRCRNEDIECVNAGEGVGCVSHGTEETREVKQAPRCCGSRASDDVFGRDLTRGIDCAATLFCHAPKNSADEVGCNGCLVVRRAVRVSGESDAHGAGTQANDGTDGRRTQVRCVNGASAAVDAHAEDTLADNGAEGGRLGVCCASGNAAVNRVGVLTTDTAEGRDVCLAIWSRCGNCALVEAGGLGIGCDAAVTPDRSGEFATTPEPNCERARGVVGCRCARSPRVPRRCE